MRRSVTTRFVVVISLLLLGLCVGWAFLVQSVVPDACSDPQPPANAQFLHCP